MDPHSILGQTDFTSEELGVDTVIYDDPTFGNDFSDMNGISGLGDANGGDNTPTPAPVITTPRKERSDKERSSSSKDNSNKEKSSSKSDKDRTRSDRKDDKDRKSSKDDRKDGDSHKRHRDSNSSKDVSESPSKKARHDDKQKSSSSTSHADTSVKERRSSISNTDMEGDFITMAKSKLEESTDAAVLEFRNIIADYKRNEFMIKISSALGSSMDTDKMESNRKEVAHHLRTLADKYETL